MHSIKKVNGKITDNKPLISDAPFHPGPVYRPPSKPIRHDMLNKQSSQSSPDTEDVILLLILPLRKILYFRRE